jgi:hypothetical protein
MTLILSIISALVVGAVLVAFVRAFWREPSKRGNSRESDIGDEVGYVSSHDNDSN